MNTVFYIFFSYSECFRFSDLELNTFGLSEGLVFAIEDLGLFSKLPVIAPTRHLMIIFRNVST